MFDSANPDMVFMDRYMWLQDNLPIGTSIKLVDTKICDTTKAIDLMYGEYTEAGYEGQMIRQNTAYESKRSKNLLKRKEFITEEFEVVNVEEGNGNWSGYAKRFVLKPIFSPTAIASSVVPVFEHSSLNFIKSVF